MDAKPLPRIFNLLMGEKDPAVEDALLEALPHLGAQASDAALNLLCDRGRSGAMAALLTASAGFEPDLKSKIHARLDSLHPGLRVLMQSEDFENRAAAIGAVVSAQDFKSASLLADSLRHPCSRTRELAAQAIRSLSEEIIAPSAPAPVPTRQNEVLEKKQKLAEGLKAVITNWDAHHQIAALEAALWLFDFTEQTIAERVAHEPSKLAHAIETILERASDPRLAPAVVRSLGIPPLKPAAMRCISQAKEPVFLKALVEQAWLLGDSAIEQGFHGIPPNPNFDSWIEGATSLRSDHASSAVQWVAVSGGARDRLVARLMAFRDRGSDAVRRAAFWRLVSDETPQATAALDMIASRINDPHSAIAARECKRRHRREHPDRPYRDTSAASLAITKALNMFIEEHDRLPQAQRAEVGNQLKALGPELSRQLSHKLDSTHGHERAATLRAIRTLGWATEYQQRIYQLVRDPEAVVRLAALDALRDDQSASALRLVKEAMNDSDARVQATAIEVLEKLDVSKALPAVRSKLGSASGRVRANAIKALWNVELKLAVTELERMLRDKSPEHRISALWIVEHLKIGQIVDRLSLISSDDPDARVRARAARTLRRIKPAPAMKGAAHAR